MPLERRGFGAIRRGLPVRLPCAEDAWTVQQVSGDKSVIDTRTNRLPLRPLD